MAFSGGIDSSLVASLVAHAFPDESLRVACIGLSPSLPQEQLETARDVAAHIGIRLIETPTTEGEVEEYVANEGMACYACKNTLYSTLEAVGAAAVGERTKSTDNSNVVLFNGTNFDDFKDITRLGTTALRKADIK